MTGWFTDSKGNKVNATDEGISEKELDNEIKSDVIEVQGPVTEVQMGELPKEEREVIEMFYKQIWDNMTPEELDRLVHEIYKDKENKTEFHLEDLAHKKFLELPESTRQEFIEHMILTVEAP
jgi:hypothetical protein